MKFTPSLESHTIPLLTTCVMVIFTSVAITYWSLGDLANSSCGECAASVQGASTASLPKKDATLKIVDNQDGSAILVLNLPRQTRIAGIEAYAKLEGKLVITDVSCTETFTCIDTEMTEENIAIIALQEPEDAGHLLTGMIPVATISYAPSHPGSLEINGPNMEPSTVVPVDQPVNILSPEASTHFLGF